MVTAVCLWKLMQWFSRTFTLGIFQKLAYVTVLLCVGPVLVGLAGTLLPSFGYLPVLNEHSFHLEPWKHLVALPGLWTSVRISFLTGLFATLASVIVTFGFCAYWHDSKIFRGLHHLLSPLLAIPHLTAALGISFLLSPSGWLLRLLSPWLTGYQRPPLWSMLQDSGGGSLVGGLLIKEVPFLLLMIFSALNQIDVRRSLRFTSSIGYAPSHAWLKAVLPQVYAQLRLPIIAVLSFSMSVVDVAIVLGPTTPAPLSVRLVDMFQHPQLSERLVASAGAVLQLIIILTGIMTWYLIEKGGSIIGQLMWTSGHRGRRSWLRKGLFGSIMGLILLAMGLGFVSMLIWSFATYWRFPFSLPAGWTVQHWIDYRSSLLTATGNTLLAAMGATLISMTLALGVLEAKRETKMSLRKAMTPFFFLPLWIPQVAFLFGIQVLFVWLRMDGTWQGVTLLHILFVYPYVYLTLADPYAKWDQRYAQTAFGLGKGYLQMLFRVKLPMLLRPILAATAVGFSVSAGLYLPTLFVGGGRYPTLITEAVTLSAGGDQRLIGMLGVLQLLIPLMAFGAALLIPHMLHRQRRDMHITH